MAPAQRTERGRLNPFLKDHAGPLVGSATLHLIVGAAAIAATFWSVAPHLTPPAAIEAYIAARPAPRPAAPPPAPTPPAAEPAPVVEPTPAPVPDPRIAERAAAETRAAVRAEHAQELRLAEVKREAVLAAQHRAQEAEEAKRESKRRAAAAEAQRRTDEAKRKAEVALDAERRADTAERAARESDLARRLAQEEHRDGAARSGLLDKYITEIQAQIERAWNRPPTARPGLSCTVFVSQVPGGTVTSVRIGDCNGDAAVQQSITLAVYRASPLPTPPDPSLFERNLRLIFEPHER